MLVEKITKVFEQWEMVPNRELLSYARKCDLYSLDKINTNELQKSICEYLDVSSLRMQALSTIINRHKEPPMADIFTEAMNLAVTAILRNPLFSGIGWTVSSEKNFMLRDFRYIKPDIGIWNGDSLVGAIECKTNLGFDRYNWKTNFQKRIDDYVNNGVSSNGVLFVVTTDSNWSGFPANDPRTGKTWLTLCNRGSWFGGKNDSNFLSDSINYGAIDRLVEALISLS